MSKKFISGDAGFMQWGSIRSIAASCGCTVEESRGWLRRSFVIRGTEDQLKRCAKRLLELPNSEATFDE